VAHGASIAALPDPAGGLAITVRFARLGGAPADHSP
jgi:hypothetical protein